MPSDPPRVFVSNDGRGPLRARIVEVLPYGNVRMQRWHKKSPSRLTYFTLPARFLESPSCGWKEKRRAV